MKGLAVLVSGNGSNFQALIDAVKNKEINAEIRLCISSKPGVYALERASAANIPAFIFSKKGYPDTREMFRRMAELIREYGVDYIVLAGYMTILPPEFIKEFPGKIINIHPSLIPKYCGDGFYGIRVHRAVLEGGETESGATVHFVDEGVDTGKIIKQVKVPVFPDDTPEALASRVLEKEHILLKEAVAQLVNNG